jgi:hypothetical protein
MLTSRAAGWNRAVAAYGFGALLLRLGLLFGPITEQDFVSMVLRAPALLAVLAAIPVAAIMAAWQPPHTLRTIFGAGLGIATAILCVPALLFTGEVTADAAFLVLGGPAFIAWDIIAWVAAGIGVVQSVPFIRGLKRLEWRLAVGAAFAAAGHVGITWRAVSAIGDVEAYGGAVILGTPMLLAAVVVATIARPLMSRI